MDFELFKQRKVKAREVFTIRQIDKNTCYEFIRRHHYLGNARFFCVYGFGLYHDGILVGVSVFSNPNGSSALMGWFGEENDTKDILELSRLCMIPTLNKTNATSYLLGNSLRMLKKLGVRAVITLADASRHIGSIYQVCNFKYYGLTGKRPCFYGADGSVDARGEKASVHGVWLDRTYKHRYCYVLDKRTKVLLKEEKHPTEFYTIPIDCCGGTGIVHDKRFDEYYTCPKCCGYIQRVDKDGNPIGELVKVRSIEYKPTTQLTFDF